MIRVKILLPALFFLILVSPSSAKDAPFSVVLIAIDTLRADHLESYGYNRRTSPSIDALAQDGVLFKQAISQSAWTLPSFASVFTSKYPWQHGVYDPERKLKPSEQTLTQVLRQAGYTTAAFTEGTWFWPRYGFDRGFGTYVNKNHKYLSGLLPDIRDWLRVHGHERFFLFIHASDTHAPYAAPPAFNHKFDDRYEGMVDRLRLDIYFTMAYNHEWIRFYGPPTSKGYSLLLDEIRQNPRDREHIISHYDDLVSWVDSNVGTLLKELKESGLYDKTIVIFTSDHGEELGERGRFGHTYTVNEEVARVPLIIRHPGIKEKGRRVSRQVQLIDLAPTILDFMAVPVPAEFVGRSLASLMAGTGKNGEENYAFTSADTPQKRLAVFSIRSNNWKLIADDGGSNARLFNLTKDPKELRNVSGLHPEITARLAAELRKQLQPAFYQEADSVVPLKPEEIESLQAMGYLR